MPTLDETKIARDELEQAIVQLLQDYEKHFGLPIRSIDVQDANPGSKDNTIVVKVNISMPCCGDHSRSSTPYYSLGR